MPLVEEEPLVIRRREKVHPGYAGVWADRVLRGRRIIMGGPAQKKNITMREGPRKNLARGRRATKKRGVGTDGERAPPERKYSTMYNKKKERGRKKEHRYAFEKRARTNYSDKEKGSSEYLKERTEEKDASSQKNTFVKGKIVFRRKNGETEVPKSSVKKRVKGNSQKKGQGGGERGRSCPWGAHGKGDSHL